MTNLARISTALKREIVSGPALIECESVAISIHEEEGNSRITVFLMADEILSARMFSLPKYQYSLHMLMNTWRVYATVMRQVKRGQLRLATSELMTAVISGVLEGHAWGTSADAETATFHVPEAKFGENFSGLASPSSAQIWTVALLDTEWPALPEVEPDENTPELRIVHIPAHNSLQDSPARDMVTRLTIGWNYCQIDRDGSYVEGVGQEILEDLAVAQTIIRY